MKNKEIIKINTAIAKFMGGKKVNWFAEPVVILPYSHQAHLGLPKIMNIHNHTTWGKAYIIDLELKYHSSWDWLMPVVEKISELGYEVIVCGRKSGEFPRKPTTVIYFNMKRDKVLGDVRGEEETSIEATYKAVFEFITWYNKKSKHEK